MEEKYKRLEDYGGIGNLETCALVGADGSVDWLCLPHLESPSVFSALLDSDRGGLFRIRPTEKYRSVQKYIDATNILKTIFYTAMGSVSVTDFMPVKTIEAGDFISTLFRKVQWIEKGENADNGAIAAAATTSLPEVIGGVRNWDYRFAWIRDSALTVQALYHLGHDQEAENFRAWINGIVDAAHDSGKLRILYPLRGGDTVPEQILENLSGYKDSGPVRIGNKASDQRQLDIYGELLNTLYETTRYGRDVPKSRWHVVKGIVEHVCATWDEKDSGIGEARNEPKEYTYSKLMCWVAVDRGIKIALQKGFEAPLDTWHAAANAIRKDILNRGFSKRLNSFVRSFDTEDLDAASLQIPFTGFLPFSDERVQGTIDAVIRHLTAGEGLVLRYRAEDGLPGAEGSFALCSLWLVKALSLSGWNEEAEKFFTKILDYMSPLGLISEEIDPATGMLLGNMPQAFSHTGIINAALHIGIGRGKSHRGPEPMGEEHREKGGERWREHYQHRAGQH